MRTKPYSKSDSGKGDDPRNLGQNFHKNFPKVDFSDGINMKVVKTVVIRPGRTKIVYR